MNKKKIALKSQYVVKLFIGEKFVQLDFAFFTRNTESEIGANAERLHQQGMLRPFICFNVMVAHITTKTVRPAVQCKRPLP